MPDFDRLPGNARYVDVPLWRLRRVPTHILPQVRVLMPRVVFDSELDDIRSLLKNAREIGVRERGDKESRAARAGAGDLTSLPILRSIS